ncbi:MAG: DegT/DnrJ/EryC1/StrS family aminotransferase [Magnetococcales bacterium]|nr:DegT/DnrJ/EryC1/StrS family aminotransferase [Magnetococcales bacterium]MBF0321825.1 DegT/DnrJ/EryC1/StrS family aminotransferase [Magnetococcales bacterium]
MSTGFIPVNTPLLDGSERRYLNECIDSGWISSEGPFVRRFEEAFAAVSGRRHGVAVSNGSDALELSVVALGIGPGDEVIMPAFTIISCAQAVVRAGATPVLVESDPVTWNMRVDQIAAKITPRTRAIMPVHIFGLPVDMDPILALAEKHGLFIIEDNAECIGQHYKGRPCGSFGQISAFSFYANKHVSTGEGGMVLVDDPALADRCRNLRNLSFEEPRFVHHRLGWNMRITNLQAAVGLAQVERLDHFIQKKRQMGSRYTEGLRDLSGVRLPLEQTDYARNVYWVYGIVLEKEMPFDAREAIARLHQRGIGARPFFWPMHEQPVFQAMGLFQGESYPVAEELARRGFYPPSGLGLTPVEQERVIDELRDVLVAHS